MRRLALRRLRADDGISLLETVVGLVVFSLIMTGLAASMTLFVHNTAVTKTRNAATSLAQQLVEQARGTGYSDMATCAAVGVPTAAPFRGSGSFTVVTSSAAGCIPYQRTNFNGSGYKFNVTELVLLNKYVTNSTSGQPLTEKYLVVQLSWSAPTPGTYELDTAVNNTPSIAASDPQGLQIDPQDATGTQLTSTSVDWNYWVIDSSNNNVVDPGQTQEGGQPLLAVPPGTYTCIIETNQSSDSLYDPGANGGKTVDSDPTTGYARISGPCTVTAGQITDWVTVWTALTDCAFSTAKATLVVSVVDPNNNPVGGVTVTLQNANGHTGTPAPVTTNSSGVATFSKSVPQDLYTYTLSKTGYVTQSNLGPVCVGKGTTNQGPITIAIDTSATCTSSSSKGSVQVTVVDVNNNPISGVKAVLANQNGNASPGSVNTNPSGVALFNNNVLGDSYTYTLSKTNFTTIGPSDPFCVLPGSTYYIKVTMNAEGSNGCIISTSKGSLQVTVKAKDGTMLNGVTVTLKNVNGNGGTPGAVKTNNTGIPGVAVFNQNVPADTYTWTLSTYPAGYVNPGTQGPWCVVAGQANTPPPTVLTGIMTLKVAITNSDSQPKKNYTITATDSNNNATTQNISVTRTKTGTTTFSNMPTDVYSVKVCTPNYVTNNCDTIYLQSWNLTAINTVYTVSLTDVQGGA